VTSSDRLAARLRESATRVLATFVLIPRVEIVETLAHAGFEAIVLDLEHGPFTVAELPPLLAAARSLGMHTLVRVGQAEDAIIGSVLDTGPDGIVVPHVESAEQARRIVRAGRFPPEGERSINPYVRGNGYGAGGGDLLASNAGTALVLMVEGRRGIAELDGICAVRGVDALFVGPVDLSAALGVPNQPEHPTVVAEVRSIFERLRHHDVAGGIYAPTPEAARRWFEAGARLVAVSADVAMIYRSFAAIRAEASLGKDSADEDH
jgi:2-keto-3-deoxy-L-rhamnonate aldolase RhmA